MRAPDRTTPPADPWTSLGHLPLRAEDAVECGWSREGAERLLAAFFPGANGVTLAVLAYRAERARVAAAYQAIRLAKVNIKKLLKSPDVTVAQLRVLAQELGWTVREDEEGVTVPVNELIPFFRRPVVRDLLDAKLRQVGLAPREG
jgi:hypothetical protein